MSVPVTPAHGGQLVARSVPRREIIATYGSSLLQGIALITFPAAGPLLTDPAFHGLSDAQFGALFVPQILAAIVASTLAGRLAPRLGAGRVLGIGLAADVVAMVLLAASTLLLDGAAYPLLLVATAAVGAGFGFAITSLNALVFDRFRATSDTAVTALHVCAGVGQVGAALLLGLFIGLGAWWGAPLTVAGALVAMLAFQLPLGLRLESVTAGSGPVAFTRLPLTVWGFVGAVFLYGTLEGTFGNWGPIYLEQDAGLAMGQAALGLSIFWAMVTTGRVLFALLALRRSPRVLYAVAPAVVGGVLLILPILDGTAANLVAIGVAGLAMSFFFPYSVSLASAVEPRHAETISGLLVAALMLGTGYGATSVGLLRGPSDLATVLQLSTLYAAVMVLLAIALIRPVSTEVNA